MAKPLDFRSDDLISSLDGDCFQHSHLAEKIVQHLSLATVPPNLAIYGPWGSGKSSLLELVKMGVARTARAPQWFAFDAWAYQTEDSLILAMLAQLTSETNFDFKASLVKILKASALSMIDPLLKAASLDTVSVDTVVKNLQLVESDKSFASKPLTIKDEFEKVVRELSKLNQNVGERQVILAVDNLDRCKPDTAIRVLETLFLISNIKHCTLVVAVDQGVLISFLNRYYLGTNFNGARYLEKVFPVAYRIPDPWVTWNYGQAVDFGRANSKARVLLPDQIYPFLRRLLEGSAWADEKGGADSIFATVYHYLAQPRILRNPRRIKRIVRFIYGAKPDDQADAERTLFLVILSDIWPDAFEYLLTVSEDTWEKWIDYLAGLRPDAPESAKGLDDQALHDFIYQIRVFYTGDNKNPEEFKDECPVRDAEDLMNNIGALRELGL